MITKTGIEYSENSDLSNSSTIEENGTVNSITIPSWPIGTYLYCQAYVIEDGNRINSSIAQYRNANYLYIKNEYAGQNTATFTKTNSGNDKHYYYSFDTFNWTEMCTVETGNPTTITFGVGEKIYINSSVGGGFGCDLNITCNEIYSTGGSLRDTFTYNGYNADAYSRIFKNSTTLIDASDLDFSHFQGITTLFGLRETFRDCSNLQYPPDFGNVEYLDMSCFSHAFEGTKIDSIDFHSLKGLDMSCFAYAFKNSALRTIQMGNLSDSYGDNSAFKQAFYGCVNLTQGIDFSNFLVYRDAYADICKEMYYGCTNLSEVTVPNKVTDTNGNSILTDWLYGAGTNVQGTKTVYCPTGVTVPSGNSGVPTGWTRVDY